MLTGLDRVTAAKQAGYAGQHIDVTAYKLSRKPKITAALAKAKSEAERAGRVDANYVIEAIRSEIEHLKSNADRTPAASQAIFRGTELLGKTIALFTERVEEDRSITITIEPAF